jgi:hypothetical protein
MAKETRPGDRTRRDDLLSEAKRELKPLLLRVYLVVLALMLLILAAGAASGIERWQLFIDLADNQEAVLVGAFSQLGLLLWWTTVTVTALTWSLGRRRGRGSEALQMCGWAALLTAFLAMDDLFVLHDYVFPESVHVPEGIILAIILSAAASFIFRFRAIFLASSNRLVFVVALLFLSASVAVDAFPQGFRGQGTLEDSFKFVGIATWLYYFAGFCMKRLGTTPALTETPLRKTARR